MADRENLHDIARRVEVVERHISGTTAGNDQLAQVALGRPADKRMALENRVGVENLRYRFLRQTRILRQEELEQPLKVCLRPAREAYLRHRLSRGRLAPLPATRASK